MSAFKHRSLPTHAFGRQNHHRATALIIGIATTITVFTPPCQHRFHTDAGATRDDKHGARQRPRSWGSAVIAAETSTRAPRSRRATLGTTVTKIAGEHEDPPASVTSPTSAAPSTSPTPPAVPSVSSPDPRRDGPHHMHADQIPHDSNYGSATTSASDYSREDMYYNSTSIARPLRGAPQQRGPLTPQTQTRPNRLHTHTHPPKRLAHPRSLIPPLSTLTSRATRAHPTSPRSTGFCAIWDCISSSSSSCSKVPNQI